MRTLRIAAIAAAVLTVCTGCHVRRPESGVAVVTQITVTSQQEGMLIHRSYSDPDKMSRILNALRLVGQRSDPEVDPEALPLRSYCITLERTDGDRQIWRTKGDRYIRQGRGPWQQADPQTVSDLNLLLQTLPGDMVDERHRLIGAQRRLAHRQILRSGPTPLYHPNTENTSPRLRCRTRSARPS